MKGDTVLSDRWYGFLVVINTDCIILPALPPALLHLQSSPRPAQPPPNRQIQTAAGPTAHEQTRCLQLIWSRTAISSTIFTRAMPDFGRQKSTNQGGARHDDARVSTYIGVPASGVQQHSASAILLELGLQQGGLLRTLDNCF